MAWTIAGGSRSWAIDLALGGAIVANAVFMTDEEPWFRDLARLALTALALIAWLELVRVFPFEFGAPRGQ